MIPLFKPFMPEIPEINSILLSGALAYGSYTKEFEEKLKDYFKKYEKGENSCQNQGFSPLVCL